MDRTKSVDTIAYNAGDKPFDFVEEGRKTALVCESDGAVRDKLIVALEGIGYYVTKGTVTPSALRRMRVHVYDLIIVGDNYDEGGILEYLRNLAMGVRRNIFVILLSDTIRTMDNMAAFGMSVNLIINRENIDDADLIIQNGIADNAAFYRPFKEAMKKTGRL